uniref:Protein kinase domain-containing protein n=1 Tax=Gongylonema pulchrum TaxID=637853 RepID=A0A183E4B4_9BILA
LSTTAATSSLSDSAANVPPGAASQPVQQISWNPRIFAAAVRELAPTLNWSEVIMHLDQTNFVVRNKPQLQLLTALLLEGLGSNSFPIGLLYREWNFHKLGQLSWIEQILLNTDVFCFADYPYKAVNLSVLKVQPEETRELSNWRCLDLVDTLVRLGELKKFMNIVLNILLRPVNLCPDVLLLALLQIQIPTSTLRMHLCQLLIPALIGSHPNAVAVLNVAWNSEDKAQLRPAILTALSNFYVKSPDDQAKLTRILEIGHELKPDDAFASQIISFIRRRMPTGVMSSCVLPQDTMKILLSALGKATCMSSTTVNELTNLYVHIESQKALKSGQASSSSGSISTSRAQLNISGSAHAPTTTGMFASGLSTTSSAPVQQQQQQQPPGISFASSFPLGTTGFGTTSREVLESGKSRNVSSGVFHLVHVAANGTSVTGKFAQLSSAALIADFTTLYRLSLITDNEDLDSSRELNYC